MFIETIYVTFQDVRQGKLQEPFTVVANELTEHLPWDNVTELRDGVTIGELNTTVVEVENVFERVKLVDGLVANRGYLRDEHLCH